MHRNVYILAFCQAMLFTGTGLIISATALIGKDLAPTAAWATVPLAIQYLTTMLVIFVVSHWMKIKGRRHVFMRGALAGASGMLMASLGIWLNNFFLFMLASVLVGMHNAIGQFYRFAAAESVPSNLKARAISMTLAGGVLAAFLGPNLAVLTKNMLEHVFLASYLSLVLTTLLTAFLTSHINMPEVPDEEKEIRSLLHIARQPKYLMAMLAGMIGYGSMNFLMTATPLAMVCYSHPFSSTAIVIQWHLFAMFAPSFFTGDLIRRFGVIQVMLTGCIFIIGCALINLNGTSLRHFELALIMLGIGWNFLYIGATTMLTDTYSPAEKSKAQGLNDTFIFATLTVTSFASGAMVDHFGWQTINKFSLYPVSIVLLGLIWLSVKSVRKNRLQTFLK